MLNILGARRAHLCAVVVLVMACTRDLEAPAHAAPRAPVAARRVAGIIAVTFHNIGSPNMTASAIFGSSVAEVESLYAVQLARSGTGGHASLDLTLPANTNGSGDATIELAPLGVGASTANGTRYFNAQFRVRNAQSTDSAAFDTPRHNLTFVAVASAHTLSDSPVLLFDKSDGTPAAPALLHQLAPSGLVVVNGGAAVVPLSPDVLQVFTEQAIAAIAPPADVTNTFPYGFVVRRTLSTTTRTLDPSPPPGEFEGTVSFAFRIPLQPSPTDDPTTITVLMLALDDSDVRMTQSLEEQTPAGASAVAGRAASLNADTVGVMPGNPGSFTPVTQLLCSVRTTGPASLPTAFLVNVPSTFLSVSPQPAATNGMIAQTTSFRATFSSVVTNATPSNFIVRGSQSGQAFLGQTYTGNGTTAIQTPSKAFFPGEVIEASITSALSCPSPGVTQFRVATAPGQGNFFPSTTFSTSDSTFAVAVGDLNGDHNLDIVAANLSANTISVLKGNGTGTFAPQVTYSVGRHPVAVALADLDGDGLLDVIVANALDHTVSVRHGQAGGTFGPETTFPIGGARSLVVADYNGDGRPDILVANQEGTLSLLINDAAGGFLPQRLIVAHDGGTLTSVATADVNHDGANDIVATDSTFHHVSVWLGTGTGAFGPEQTFNVGAGPSAVAIGDFNKDGNPDLVVTNRAPAGVNNTVSVLLGTGTGSFGAASTLEVGMSPVAVAVTDIDGDGNLDFLTSNLVSGEASEYLGNGNGTFQSRRTFQIGASPRGIAFGDVNNDGIIDLIVANGVRPGTVSVFLERHR